MRFQLHEEVWKKTIGGGLWIGTVISREFTHPIDKKQWVVLSVLGCIALSDVDSLNPMKEYGRGEEVSSELAGDYSVARITVEAA
jgi:hypothetical protein